MPEHYSRPTRLLAGLAGVFVVQSLLRACALLAEHFWTIDIGGRAMSYRSQFNVVDFATLWKIDFIFRQQTPFDASRFARRGIVDIAGVRLQAASAEDILITKLWWAKLGESERQINDAAGVIQVQGHHLDMDYVERWVAALELDEQWRRARERAG